MLSVTESALEHSSGILETSACNLALHMTTTDDGLAARPDEQRDDDEIRDYEGSSVIVLDEKDSASIGERTLDVASRDDEAVLMLQQKNIVAGHRIDQLHQRGPQSPEL